MANAVRSSLDARLRSPVPYAPERFAGRGIVICAGGPRYFTCAWVLIWLLRRVYRIELPIQVWHLGRRELSQEMQLLLEELQVEVVDAEHVVARYPARVAGGWPLKPYAIQQSRFSEVLYLDADTVPLTDPCKAFDWPAYRESGLLMWPDIVDLMPTNPIWEMLGLAPCRRISVEAGILLVEKRRAWDILDLAVLLNEHVEEIYGAIYGDKDTFLLASLVLGRPPSLIHHRPFVFNNDLVQRDPEGEPFLEHRSLSKWSLGGSNRPLSAASLMPECQRAIDDLRERWSGVVFNPPPRSERARAEEARLTQLQYFRYETSGSDARRLELLPGARVGEGRGFFEQHWAMVERDGALILQFFSSSCLAVELSERGDGSWHGRCVTPAGFQARLIEEATRRTWPQKDDERIPRSAAHLISALIGPSLFAAGFDQQRLSEVRAALILINDSHDDVPEQVKARLHAGVPEQWERALSTIASALAKRRDQRDALTTRAAHSHIVNWDGYERVV